MRVPGLLQLSLLGMFLSVAPGHGWMRATAQSTSAPRLNEAERALVAGSRSAIVRSGMSPAYFDRHFTLVQVVDRSGDRRVVWSFSVNEYATTVTDALGYYTANGKRIDTHSVTTTLRATSDIIRTISRRKANQIMQQCIGAYRNPSVEYRAGDARSARLFLTAESVPKTKPLNEKRGEEEEREARERQSKPKRSDADVIEDEDEDHGPPIIVGSVDLQTGKCTKGELQVARVGKPRLLSVNAMYFRRAPSDQR
jgi:hypothetical protein